MHVERYGLYYHHNVLLLIYLLASSILVDDCGIKGHSMRMYMCVDMLEMGIIHGGRHMLIHTYIHTYIHTHNTYIHNIYIQCIHNINIQCIHNIDIDMYTIHT